MSVKSVFRYLTWTLEPDKQPDAAPVTYAMSCDVCGVKSADFEDIAPVQQWVFGHVGSNPTHHSFTEIIHRPWHAWMKEGGPT
jgi:hypothetical protein